MRTRMLEVKYVKWVMLHLSNISMRVVAKRKIKWVEREESDARSALLDISWDRIKPTIEVFNGSRKRGG